MKKDEYIIPDDFKVLKEKKIGDRKYRLTREVLNIDVPSGSNPVVGITYTLAVKVLFFYITIREFNIWHSPFYDSLEDLNDTETYIRNTAEDAFDALTVDTI